MTVFETSRFTTRGRKSFRRTGRAALVWRAARIAAGWSRESSGWPPRKTCRGGKEQPSCKLRKKGPCGIPAKGPRKAGKPRMSSHARPRVWLGMRLPIRGRRRGPFRRCPGMWVKQRVFSGRRRSWTVDRLRGRNLAGSGGRGGGGGTIVPGIFRPKMRTGRQPRSRASPGLSPRPSSRRARAGSGRKKPRRRAGTGFLTSSKRPANLDEAYPVSSKSRKINDPRRFP